VQILVHLQLKVITLFEAAIVTVVTSIENGIYVTIPLSAWVMLFRIATAREHLLGKVEVHLVTSDSLYDINDSSG